MVTESESDVASTSLLTASECFEKGSTFDIVFDSIGGASSTKSRSNDKTFFNSKGR